MITFDSIRVFGEDCPFSFDVTIEGWKPGFDAGWRAVLAIADDRGDVLTRHEAAAVFAAMLALVGRIEELETECMALALEVENGQAALSGEWIRPCGRGPVYLVRSEPDWAPKILEVREGGA